jgi:hypothetical protein
MLLSVATFSFAADDTDTKGDDKEKAERGFFFAAADDKEDEKKIIFLHIQNGALRPFFYIFIKKFSNSVNVSL